ncbi:DUF3618 domain-containing protein [Pseudarthrobacter sp. J75]|uniref:DUF3618 domain-containing protein n=1 Tax=unclassified Pseudarthrobacter TaxID=2647000 RepID=UPI002E81520E|nr:MULTISPECIES: DUF3618 domain-containing protein [unclassified Pseudarthrobacter]MEE2523550.1 DUF3618 domain-containing protein [Pseudarthrobacter sp. J47]MEE2530532.1 DUF3618 domain-containing protein [Pseudarthrobacter sp. J75]
MSENPDVIRSDIEATRRRLGTNVDAVADKVTPSHVVHRQTEKVRNAVFGAKDKVMGTADSAGSNVDSALHDAGDAVKDAPHQVKAKTQGNPLAAGLVAFGAGLLLGSLLPASEKEREAAQQLKSAAEPVTTELTEAAKEMAEGLKEPAKEAVENVKATASEAAEHVKAEGQGAATDVKNRADDARTNISST